MCRECVQAGRAWELNGVCSSCRNFDPCFHSEKQCSEYDVLDKARKVCEKQQNCDACHSADPACRWAAGTCTIKQGFNTARGCPSNKARPVVTPVTSSRMCVECIEGGGIWQAGKCTTCQQRDIGFCYETKESCSLWDMRAVAVELCPQQSSCSECLYAHPHCIWMASTQSCIGSVGQYSQGTIRDTENCPLPGAYVNGCKCC